MFEFLISNYRTFPELYTKQEWINLFYEAYLTEFNGDRLFKVFFKPNTDKYEKKIKYMMEMLETGKTDISVYDVVDYDPNVIWD